MRSSTEYKVRKASAEFTTSHSHKDGHALTVVVSLSTVEYAGKKAVLSFNRDVTEQLEMADALRHRDAILEAVSFAAEKLLSGGEWEQCITAVLERLGRSISVSRAYIFTNCPGLNGRCVTSQRYEWTSPGITSQIDNPELQNFSWGEKHCKQWMDRTEARKNHPRNSGRRPS